LVFEVFDRGTENELLGFKHRLDGVVHLGAKFPVLSVEIDDGDLIGAGTRHWF
jgi:hypothetical protein